MSGPAIVYLVGAGPGDPGLITVKGLELLCAADVVLHDRLIDRRLLQHCRPQAEIINVGKSPQNHRCTQEQINDLLIDHARVGKTVVRLKGGDPYLYGRGYEEQRACLEAGIGCLVVPGISSAIAVPEVAGVPLTLRGVARTVAVITAQTGDETGLDDIPYAALTEVDTVVVLMARAVLPQLCEGMVAAGRAPHTSACCIEQGTTARQRRINGTLQTIATLADEHSICAPMVLVVGEVAARPQVDSRVPLVNRRIVLTRPRTSAASMTRSLTARGAQVISCPLIEVEYPDETPQLDQVLDQLHTFNWVMFTSMHGVTGFFRRLHATARDARALGSSRVAAIGPRTAQALKDHGIHADLVPTRHSAAGLLEELQGRDLDERTAVLVPCGNLARDELCAGLRQRRARVVDARCYLTHAVRPGEPLRQDIERADAILLYSPSAVRSFCDAELTAPGVMIACIGDTTARAARQHGLDVRVVPDDHSDTGMLDALERYFSEDRNRP